VRACISFDAKKKEKRSEFWRPRFFVPHRAAQRKVVFLLSHLFFSLLCALQQQQQEVLVVL
jgi:hypothetical protein